MPLNFNPYPYRDPREDNERFVQQISQGVQNIGNTITQNRLARQAEERQALLDKYLTTKENREATEFTKKYGAPIDANAMVETELPVTVPFAPILGKRSLKEMFEQFRAGGLKPAEARPEFMSALGEEERKQFYENANPKPAAQYVMPGANGSFIPLPAGTKPAFGGAVTPTAPKPVQAPAGYRYTADGNLEAIPGGPADAKTQKENNKVNSTFELYETARDGLMKALEGSVTGPIAGRLGAFTEDQQVAEGAVSAMAPVLKQLFRVSGEGVFTDRDQEILINMIPTRTDRPGAARRKIENIDNIVRAKLGMSQPNVSGTASMQSGKIRVSNGRETLEIDAPDLADAEADGFRRI